LAREVNKDPRLVELILRESTEVVRYRRDVLVVAHKLGLVMANAGIDQSNVEQEPDRDTVLLLPENPDETCALLAKSLRARTGASVGVIINDSHGRAFRNGTVGVAIGAYGVPTLVDLRGAPDLHGRRLSSTDVGVADEMASAASLLMGQADEGRPIILIRGLLNLVEGGRAVDLIRPKSSDLFRIGSDVRSNELIAMRRSIRRYKEMPIADEIIEQLLEAGVSAPSAHNRQPWRFAVVKDRHVKSRLAQAMADRLREDRSHDGDPAEVIEADIARSVARIDGAAAIIMVCLTVKEMDRYPDARRTAAEHQMAVQGTAMAMQNVLLAAHALNLGASVMCAPLFCPETVRTVLMLPEDWEPQALITLGFQLMKASHGLGNL
jgi:coenzyme F420-0:L-glutamate ligase/coenzyme F420-1:gamma-L-glutamate ligase